MHRSLREFALDRMLAVRLSETDDHPTDGHAGSDDVAPVTDWVAPQMPAGF